MHDFVQNCTFFSTSVSNSRHSRSCKTRRLSDFSVYMLSISFDQIQCPIMLNFKGDEIYKSSLWDTTVSKQEAMFSLLAEDTMRCSKTVARNESKRIVINSVKGPECVGLLHPCKSHQSIHVPIKHVVCAVGNPPFKVTHRFGESALILTSAFCLLTMSSSNKMQRQPFKHRYLNSKDY